MWPFASDVDTVTQQGEIDYSLFLLYFRLRKAVSEFQHDGITENF